MFMANKEKDVKTVSVVIPCYNDGLYIEEAIESVKAQTYGDIEIIVVDDGSTDKRTLDVLESFDDEIIVLHSANKGPAAARNLGVRKACGTYILPLDADDKIDKTYIQKAVDIIETDPNIGAVYCYGELFGDANGRWLLRDYSFEEMIIDNIVFVTALYRKDDWKKVGGYSECFKHGIEDYDYWLSILELGKEIYQIKETLFYYRIKNVSRTTKFNDNVTALQETYDMLYDRHKGLYLNHIDLYCKSMRRKLIDRIVYARQLENTLALKKCIDKFPVIKRIAKYVYKKVMGVKK